MECGLCRNGFLGLKKITIPADEHEPSIVLVIGIDGLPVLFDEKKHNANHREWFDGENIELDQETIELARWLVEIEKVKRSLQEDCFEKIAQTVRL